MYAVYLTIYSGNKLPPFYIGSTSVSKIDKGYKGSVRSKYYRLIWQHETRNNPHLFKVIIIKKFNDRQEAANYEVSLQVRFKVDKNPLYTNTGYFKGHIRYTGTSPNKGKKLSDDIKMKMSAARKEYLKHHPNNRQGIPHSVESKRKSSIANREAKRAKFRPIAQYTLDDQLLKIFDCVADVKHLGFNPTNVAVSANKDNRTSYGFKWKYC